MTPPSRSVILPVYQEEVHSMKKCFAFLLTLVLIFAFQGQVILENPLHIVLIAVPQNSPLGPSMVTIKFKG